MSALSIRSVNSDLPTGKNAVEKLRLLADNMRSPHMGFDKGDVKNVDEVIDSLSELESECNRLREKVETETIKSSVLRHRLQNLPDDIKREFLAIIGGAREEDGAEITNMRNQAEAMNHEMQELIKERSRLEKENVELHALRDSERARFNDLVLQLNEGMATKASKQIILNETKDALRLANQRMVDLESAMIQLQEDLVDDRAQHKLDKKQLRSDLQDARQKLKVQEEITATKKKELDKISAKVDTSNAELKKIRDDIDHHDVSVKMLNQHISRLTEELKRAREHNSDTQREIHRQETIMEQQQLIHEEKCDVLRQKYTEMKGQINYQIGRAEELQKQKTVLDEEMKAKLKTRKEDELRVNTLNEQLQQMKKKVAEKAGELAGLGNDRMDMERHLQELDDTHDAITTSLQKQIADCREVLSRDRGERQELQDKRDQQQRELEAMRSDIIDTTRDLTTKASEGKVKHDEMTRDAVAMQQKLKELGKNEATLKQQNTDLQAQYEKMKQVLEGEISRLKKEITQMTNEIGDKSTEIAEKTPGFQDLEASHAEKTNSYEQLKKDVVELRSKHHGLENTIKTTQLDLEVATKPMPELQVDLDRQSSFAVSQLRRYGDDMQEIESAIYSTGCKLKAVLKENDRFIQANTALETELAEIDAGTKRNEMDIANYLQEIARQRAILQELWENARKVEEEVAEKNRKFAHMFGNLVDKSLRRENVVGHITSGLGYELSQLADFLDKVERRRPKDTPVNKDNETEDDVEES